MAFSTPGSRPLEAQMNLTPMIDVLLVLIIIFMVAVSAIQKKGLAAEIPQASESPSSMVRTIVIQLHAAGEGQLPALRVNSTNVSWEDLQNTLLNIFKKRAERVAFIQGDGDVDYQYVAEAISIARSAGVERIGLLPKTASDSH